MNHSIVRNLLFLFLISIGLACGEDKAPFAKSLVLTLAYRPENSGSFLVTLKNTSKASLDLMLNTHEVEGKFLISGSKEKGTSFYDRNYLRKLLTSTWYSGTSELKPEAEIKWTVSLDDLVYFHGDDNPVTKNSLGGKSVSLNLDKLAVFPAPGKSCVYLKARSNGVEIPKIKQAGRGDGDKHSN